MTTEVGAGSRDQRRYLVAACGGLWRWRISARVPDYLHCLRLHFYCETLPHCPKPVTQQFGAFGDNKMTDIERAARPQSTFEEKKQDPAFIDADDASGESPTRVEEGEKHHVLLGEEEAIARVRANPDDATPIYVTWHHNDPSNPRNWPASLSDPSTCKFCLTLKITEMEEMVDNVLRQLLEFLDMLMCGRLLVCRTGHCYSVQLFD